MRKIKRSEIEWKDRFVYKTQRIVEAEDLGQPGARFQIIKFPIGAKIDLHYHKKTVEIFLILRGMAEYCINANWFYANSNDILVIQPGDWHGIINRGVEELEIAIFKVKEEENDIYWE